MSPNIPAALHRTHAGSRLVNNTDCGCGGDVHLLMGEATSPFLRVLTLFEKLRVIATVET